jgi:hypothetical protein
VANTIANYSVTTIKAIKNNSAVLRLNLEKTFTTSLASSLKNKPVLPLM